MGIGEGKMDSAQEREINRIAKIGVAIVAPLVIYAGGVLAYSAPRMTYPQVYVRLLNRQTEDNKKIDEWQRFVPLMREPFQTQYQDSLEAAVRDTAEINPRIREIKKQGEEEAKLVKYSWAAFFMDRK